MVPVRKNGLWEQQTSTCFLWAINLKFEKPQVLFYPLPQSNMAGWNIPPFTPALVPLKPPARGLPSYARPLKSSRSRHGTQGHLPLLASLACTGHRIAGDDLHGVKGVLGVNWEFELLAERVCCFSATTN